MEDFADYDLIILLESIIQIFLAVRSKSEQISPIVRMLSHPVENVSSPDGFLLEAEGACQMATDPGNVFRGTKSPVPIVN